MLNHIVMMGRLTRDPELRHTQAGTAVASFTVAVDRDFKDKETGERKTDFIDCVAWRSTGGRTRRGISAAARRCWCPASTSATASPRTATAPGARPRRGRMTISSCLVISAPALTMALRIWRMTMAICRSEKQRREGATLPPYLKEGE